MSVVKKRKHVSKKNKKDWRKYCDINDVEEFLEDQRLEERLGKFETKADSELFVVDTAGDDKPIEQQQLTAKQKKRARLAQTPKCFEVLLPTSKVPDPNAKRNFVNPFGTKQTALSKISEKRKQEKGTLVKKMELSRKNRKIALEKKRKVKQIKQNFNVDMWGGDVPESKAVPSTLCDDFIPPEAQLHNMLTTQRLRPRPPPPATVVKRAAIEAPHPGVSYNPTYQEHQELLQAVGKHEEKMMKKEAHLLRVTTGMFSRITQQQNENQWREEMSVGLPNPTNPAKDKENESESDSEYKAVNPPVKNKKKDHKTRRKQKERLLEKERLKREKIDKKKISDIYKLRKLESSVKSVEQRQQELRSLRALKRASLAETATPKLNAHKTPVQEPDLVLPEQLSGDLRHIQATTNLLKDRYEALQRRGALAGAKLMMKKKRKLKAYFKAGHKVTDQDVNNYLAKMEGQEGKGKLKVKN